MRMLGLTLLVLAVLLWQPFAAHAAFYQWVSENGTISFSDTPPPKGASSKGKDATVAEPKYRKPEVRSQPIAETGASKVKSEETAPSREVEATTSAEYPPVELYVTSWCGYCKKAKAFLTSRGIPFREYDIERDAGAAQRMARLNSRGGVPVAVIGGKTLVGFSPSAYQHALGLN
jgi:glutaredoxin-like YruB-family protein